MNIKPKKSRRGKTARTMGCAFERELAQKFREIGFVDCKTSRYVSKEKDDHGIDLVNTFPFSVQAKATNCTVPSIFKVLQQIDCEKTEYKLYALMIRNRGRYAIMELEDFFDILRMLKKENII